MAARTTSDVSAAGLASRLTDLLEERRTALRSPLAGVGVYMADLEAEIAFCRAAFVGAAVTEIALLRGATHGRLQG